jgi:anti-anti-sigma factor
MDLLKLSRSSVDGWAVVTAVGEVDVASSPALSSALDDAIGSDPRVVADLAEVGFLDSTGLGVLVQALNASRDTQGQLRLVVADPNVLKVFEVTALDEVFDIHETLGSATS